MKLELTQAQILNLAIDKFESLGLKMESRVGNNADPTKFERGEVYVGLQYGFALGEFNIPDPEIVKVEFFVSFGYDITITCELGTLRGYYDGEWHSQSRDFLRVLKEVITQGEKASEFDDTNSLE